jgi:hypothetical protein
MAKYNLGTLLNVGELPKRNAKRTTAGIPSRIVIGLNEHGGVVQGKAMNWGPMPGDISKELSEQLKLFSKSTWTYRSIYHKGKHKNIRNMIAEKQLTLSTKSRRLFVRVYDGGMRRTIGVGHIYGQAYHEIMKVWNAY